MQIALKKKKKTKNQEGMTQQSLHSKSLQTGREDSLPLIWSPEFT